MPTPDDRWERLAAAGGRLLGEHCEATGHYVQDGIYRYESPQGGRSHLCRSHWVDAWLAAGRPDQPLLAGVEVALGCSTIDPRILVRNRRLGTGSPTLSYPPDGWAAFLAVWTANPLASPDLVCLPSDLGGGWRWCRDGSALRFTDHEIQAFSDLAHAGEFTVDRLQARRLHLADHRRADGPHS